MKSARSLRLGRVVPAEEITYDDCIADDVVCDFCGNRVFKAVRAEGESPVHYLSHYHAQSEEARLCEERQAAHEGGGTVKSTLSRGQSLPLRVAALSRVLAAIDPEAAIAADEIRTAYRGDCALSEMVPLATPAALLKSAATQAFRLVASYRGHRSDLPSGPFATDVPSLLRELRLVMRTMPSPPASERWSSWTSELLSLLVLAESAPALDNVYAHALGRLIRQDGDGPADVVIVLRSMLGKQHADSGRSADANRIRSVIVREMWRVVEALDPTLPVPPAEPRSSQVSTTRRPRHEPEGRRPSRQANEPFILSAREQ